MAFDSKWQGCIRLVPLAMLLLSCQLLSAQRLEPPVDELIRLLEHDSFATRQAAALALTSAGLEQWRVEPGMHEGTKDRGNEKTGVIGSLALALRHDSAEVRLAAARILREISVEAHNAEIDRLLNPRGDPTSIRLDWWPSFSVLVGDDMAARIAFADVSRRFGSSPLVLASSEHRARRLQQLGERLDPYRLNPDDTVAWTMLLLLSLQPVDSSQHLTPRMAVSMSHPPMGPDVPTTDNGRVLNRLIDRWVRQAGPLCGGRERLLIAMRYECRDAAQAICDRVFEDPSAPPATLVTALLAASVLGQDDLQSVVTRALQDDRVAHVWQLIPSSKTKIRTEVRDVALAVLLQHGGIDPRTAGFAELQADPMLRFRDHSLGFADDRSRAECRQRAENLLAR